MAKNTLSTAYRKINVDEFSEDKFEEDAVDDASQGPNESEVSGMLAQYPFKPFSISQIHQQKYHLCLSVCDVLF